MPPLVFPTVQTFAVDFSREVDGHVSSEIAGRGTLTVNPTEPHYVLHGRTPRRWLRRRESVERSFWRDQIWNVRVRGTAVIFNTCPERDDAVELTYVCTCESPEVAAAMAALLPRSRQHEFAETEGFHQDLWHLPETAVRSKVVDSLLLMNLAAFVMLAVAGADWLEGSNLEPYALYGANNASVTTGGEWWRLVTSLFLHYGFLHLILNLWALQQVGPMVERLFGRLLFTLVYIGSGVAGSLATIVWHGDDKWSAGASGAVFGVYGALIGYLFRERKSLPAGVFRPVLRSTVLFAGFNLIFGGVHPNIDNAAHLGGFVTGTVLGWLSALPVAQPERQRAFWRRGLAGFAALLAITTLGVVAAPRYNYLATEELAWNKLIAERAAAFKALHPREEAAFAAARDDPTGRAARTWIEQEAIPFLEQRLREIDALPLIPGRLTAERRALVRRADALRLGAMRELATQLATGEPGAWERYQRAQDAIALTEVEATRLKPGPARP